MTARRTVFLIAAFVMSINSEVNSQTTAQPRFDVASVKPAGDTFSTRPDRAAGRIRWTTQLCYLVGYAYRLDFSLVSGPHCGSAYAIEATFDPTASDDQVRLMIQFLLAERFKLRTHHITSEVAGYGLVIGKGGFKLREAPANDDPPAIFTTIPEQGVLQTTGRRVSMTQLAQELHRSMRTPVWDRTGLSGIYSFTLRFAQLTNTDAKTDTPSLSTALRESLGLRLEKQRGTVESLVIDSIDEPTVN